MTISTDDIAEVIAQRLEGTAWWRSEKAKEYPEDAERNLDAQRRCEAMATAFRQGEATKSMLAEYAKLWEEEDDTTLLENLNEATGYIDSMSHLDHPDDLLDTLIRMGG